MKDSDFNRLHDEFDLQKDPYYNDEEFEDVTDEDEELDDDLLDDFDEEEEYDEDLEFVKESGGSVDDDWNLKQDVLISLALGSLGPFFK